MNSPQPTTRLRVGPTGWPLLMLMMLALLGGCGIDPPVFGNDPGPGQTTYLGKVIAPDGRGLGGVTVSIDNAGQILSDTGGNWRIENVDAFNPRPRITFQLDNYYTVTQTLFPSQRAFTHMATMLVPKQLHGTLPAPQGGSLTANGWLLEVPADAFLSADGGALSGNVVVRGTYITPDQTGYPELVPGGDYWSAGLAADSVDAPPRSGEASPYGVGALFTYGLLFIEAEDESGLPVTLREDAELTARLPFPPNIGLLPPTRAHVWRWDAQDMLWRLADTAREQVREMVTPITRVNAVYALGEQYRRMVVRGRLIGCDGLGAAGEPVTIAQTRVLADSKGRYYAGCSYFNLVRNSAAETPFGDGIIQNPGTDDEVEVDEIRCGE